MAKLSEAFHLHVDGVHLPEAFLEHAKRHYSFYDDDFDHELKVLGAAVTQPARQISYKLAERSQKHVAREIFRDLQARAGAHGLLGYIQCEFVMYEDKLSFSVPAQFALSTKPFAPGFRVHSRPLLASDPERFKTHEIHLELGAEGLAGELVDLLVATGLSVVHSPTETIFTASGRWREIHALRRLLLAVLATAGGFQRARLITEATVFYSLHGIAPEDTPRIVDRIEFFGGNMEKRNVALAAYAGPNRSISRS